MSKLVQLADVPAGEYGFECPGCGHFHSLSTITPNPNKAIWKFNGHIDKPTFSPSLLVMWENNKGRQICHSFITDGKIKFLADCTHALRGKEVELINTDDYGR